MAAITPEQALALTVSVSCFSLVLVRRIKILYISLSCALVLLAFGIVTPWQALSRSINWEVLGIYWGFGMLSIAFGESGVPAYLARHIIRRASKESHAIFYLSTLAAMFSSFMPNPVVIMLVAPIAISVARRLRSSLFSYLVPVAISSNAVTTVTMIADPPATILALKTGMKFFDFYWFRGRLGLGVISVIGAVASLLFLLVLLRGMDRPLSKAQTPNEAVPMSLVPSMIFGAGVLALALLPVSPGITSLGVGFASLAAGRRNLGRMVREFDRESFLFILGIFVVVSSLEITGILGEVGNWFLGLGIRDPTIVLAILVWVSVALSSFIDNVPYTMLMIPVCTQIAANMGVSPFPFLYAMLIGTGIGGNITPVGATANVIACGILERQNCRVPLSDYLKMSLPFSVIAVASAHIVLQITWM